MQEAGEARARVHEADIGYIRRQSDLDAQPSLHVGGDGRLKTLNFAIQSKAHRPMSSPSVERVDGSSLFSASCDLYVVPRLATAFLNPFSTPRWVTVQFLRCRQALAAPQVCARLNAPSSGDGLPSRPSARAQSTASSPRRPAVPGRTPAWRTTSLGRSRGPGRTYRDLLHLAEHGVPSNTLTPRSVTSCRMGVR